jgi:hypothetical protein
MYFLPIRSYFFHLTTVRSEWNYNSVVSIGLHGLHKIKIASYFLCHDFIQCSLDDALHAWFKKEKNEASCY